MPLNETIKRFFNNSKQADEFEFICTLINYKGIGSRLSTSNLLEWFEAIEFYKELYAGENDLHKKLRLGLLLYSTFFESSDLYNIIGSLSRITLGFRSTPYFYFKHPKADRWFGTSEKISLVSDILIDSGFEEIEQFFVNNHVKPIRNTFFHSAYSLEKDDYQLHDSEPIFIDNVAHSNVSISDFLIPRIDKVTEFFDVFKLNYFQNYEAYKINKVVRGRFPEEMDITILGSDLGLVGFSAGGSNIRLENDFWTGLNIRFNSASEVDGYIVDELTRQINKETVRSNDGALQHLYDVITGRDKELEKQDLSKVYMRFAQMLQDKANKEESDFKQTSLYQYALTYYEKMYELDDNRVIHQDFAVLKFIVGDRTDDNNLRKEALKTIINCIDLNNLQENILKNTLQIITALREKRLDISEELQGVKKIIDSISIKEFQQLIEDIKNKLVV
ncbi:MAG: hypothetical protein KAS71_17460 [Bacteroidales bacterium]|nr:hypothetical protein [Bacteroidales bacterium]